jgi:hypothetical protein
MWEVVVSIISDTGAGVVLESCANISEEEGEHRRT